MLRSLGATTDRTSSSTRAMYWSVSSMRVPVGSFDTDDELSRVCARKICSTKKRCESEAQDHKDGKTNYHPAWRPRQ